jgi:hypothetical protein
VHREANGLRFHEIVKYQEHDKIEKETDGIAQQSGYIYFQLVHIAVFIQIFFYIQDLDSAGGRLYKKIPYY